MFRTHWNYIKCLNNLFTDFQISVNIATTSHLDPAITRRFERLSQITQLSIQAELNACDQEVAYASVIAPWIPVKCYYRLYYLESIFLYYLADNHSGFSNGGHTGVRRSLLSKVEGGNIGFSNSSSVILSEVSIWESASIFTTSSGSNISGNYYMYPDCHRSLRKKMSEYIKVDWMQKNKIKDFRKNAAKALRDSHLKPKKFLITDYFYWMRIKANYRDVDFLDFEHDVSAIDSHEYIKEYVETTEKYASALLEAISDIKVQRGILPA
ncbi:MAG: hypothetical protein ABI425_06080 [Patescibacteria group bacterium]